MAVNEPQQKRGFLVGIGLDHHDGHKRITQAEDFLIAGGSEETHERMTETAMKTAEDLRSRGKNFGSAEREELADLLKKNTPAP